MRHPIFTSLCISSIFVAAVHCNSDPNPSTSNGSPDAGTQSPDAAPNDAAGPVETCGVLQKIERDGSTIKGDETWPVGDYTVKGSLKIQNATLTIPACSIVRLAPGENISVGTGGSLKLLGGETTKVRVTSSNTAPAAGDWGYIEFLDGSSADSEIHHVVIEYGGKGFGAIYVAANASVALDHTTIKDSQTYGIQLRDAGSHLRGATDNVVTGSGIAPVQIHANSVGDLLGGTFTGNASDVILVNGGTVDKTQTWKQLGVPFRADTFTVRGAATPQQLTIEAGVTLQMKRDQNITIATAGGLHLAGTAAAPVKLTSSETSPSAGDWRYLEFNADSTSGDNVLEHAIIEYAGKDFGAVFVADSASIKMTDCTVQHNETYGLQIRGGELRDFTGNAFTDNAEGHIFAYPSVVGQIGAGTYASGGANDVIRVAGGTFTKNATWGAWGVPYRIDGSLTFNADSGSATWKVAAGATLAIGNGQTITAGTKGVLVLDGTADKHVVITSAASSPTPGIWKYIDLYSPGNSFKYADIAFGGGGNFGQVFLNSNTSLTLDNVKFSSAGGTGAAMGCDVASHQGANATTTGSNSTYQPCNL